MKMENEDPENALIPEMKIPIMQMCGRAVYNQN